MKCLLNLILLQLFHPYFVISSIETITYGEHDVSTFRRLVRIVSHPNFNRKTKYPNNKKNVWKLKLGTSCLKIEIFCTFLETNANKQCTKGDILTMTTQSKKKRYCRTKKPTKAKPVVFSEDVNIAWKADRRRNKRGFDCRIKCSDRVTTSTTTTSTTTSTPTKCQASSGPGKGKPCIFPFTWKYTGITYDGCAFDPTMNPAPWCSTLTVDGIHQSGKDEWGYCNSICPLSSGVTTLAPTTPPPTVAPGIAAECQCGVTKRSSKIINGEEAEVNEYPWMVGMSMSGTINPLCGGALISRG